MCIAERTIRELRQVIIKCAEVFRDYERQHLEKAKISDGDSEAREEKARRNDQHAKMCEEIITKTSNMTEWYIAECPKCGWTGTTELCGGKEDECACPRCFSECEE